MVNPASARRTAVFLAVALVLAAAGGAPAGPAAPPGTLRIAYPQRAVSLDAHGPAAAERISIIIGRHLYDTLVTWDPAARKFQPALAERWRIVDPTTWEFQLRRGVRFHDGSEFTAAAVKTSLERVVALRGPLTPLFTPVTAVETPDPYRVVIRTQGPMGTLLSNLTMLYIVPAGTPDWITAELIEQTIRVWQPHYEAVLTPEEAVTMIHTVGRLYQALSSGSSP
ncbi:MAG: hypothetical protein K6W08_12885 [Firmicutes bacterium]|nr:hypothetical protein [Bacillota bacterium]